MELTRNKNILIIGLGLLGGSYAMALKRQGFIVNCITKDKKSIDFAVENNIIDYGTTEIEEELIKNSDLVIFALYPKVFLEWIKEYGNLFKKGTIITDVTGVKGCIVYDIQKMLPEGVEFISAHPMAGKETSGVENSDDRIFHEANYIVVPTENNSEEAITLCEDLGYRLGFARVSRLNPNEHDNMIAFLSQLTHCIAVSLMCSNGDDNLVKYTGDSFRDLTRIAKINENMWSELFLSNKEALLNEMDVFLKTFQNLREYLANSDVDGMKEMMKLSTKRRKLFDKA